MKIPEGKFSVVHGSGPLDTCKVALVGEQPGRDEVRSHKPFTGPAGGVLDDCLRSAGVVRGECYLTNVIKDLDYPLKHYIQVDTKRQWVSEEGKQYIEYLKWELEQCSANVIVAIGNPALYALTGEVGITKWRGSVLSSFLLTGRKVIPAIHPATVIPPKNVYLNKHLITMDLQRAKVESEFPEVKRKERNLITGPSFLDVMAHLEWCKLKPFIGIDIELFNEEISCVSFATSDTIVMSVPFIGPNGDYFTPDQEEEIWLRIAEILEDPNIEKWGQNIIFDMHFKLRRYGIKTKNVHDTMVAQKILFQDYPVKLEFITAMYTDISYYKDDGKRWWKIGGTWDTLWRYNDLDSISCTDAFPKQTRDLERQGNLATYERQRRLIEPLAYMMERGIKVDVAGMYKAKEDTETKSGELKEKLNEVVGYPLNANSSKELIEHFYIRKGHKPYKKRRSDGKYTITTDETAMKRLARKGLEEASIILEIRGLDKLSSNYLNVGKVDKDGRIRCSYNPVGTRFSRISSSENIFGTGTNMQNWPHEMLRYLLADEGYIYYTLDLSQIENRIVAYVGRIPQMIDAFESGKDVHKMTAALILQKPMGEISDEPGSSSLGGGKLSERAWGKKANHAFNYDLGYRSFSLLSGIPDTEGKWIHARYHEIYPGIKGNYHPMIRGQLAKDRTLTNLFGRRTLFLDEWDDNLFRDAYSCIPQGTTGDKINEQGINYIYYNQSKFKPVELLIQVHDSIGFQIPLSIPWLGHAHILADIKESLETPLVWKEREFVVPVDISMGLNLYKEEGIEFKAKDTPRSKEEFARRLSEGYRTLTSRPAVED